MSDLSARTRSKFTADELQIYRNHFDIFDLDGDGAISAKELIKVSSHMGYRLTSKDIKELMRKLDVDASGSLSFEEFLRAMTGNKHISPEEHKAAEIRRMFMEFDKDGDGVVTVEEAHDILRKELAFTVEQSVELVKRYDKNGDGHLSYEEFVRFYKNVRSKAKQIREMFDEFDQDNSGSVSIDEAKAMLKRLDIPEDEVEGLVSIHDRNKDGELQYDEFVTFLLHS